MCVLMLLWKCCNLCTCYVLAFPITNLHFIFSVSKWSRSWRERKSGKKSSTKCIKEFISIFTSSFNFKSWCWVFLSNVWIKSSYQVLHQVFVSSLPIKSLYQVFMSSLHIKSIHQVFLSSLFIKSSYQVFVWGHSQTMFTARLGGWVKKCCKSVNHAK